MCDLKLFISSLSLLAVVSGMCADDYQVLDPEKSDHLSTSKHFVARWSDKDGVKLTDTELRQGLQDLETIWDFYTGKVGFPVPPPEPDSHRYKVDVCLSDKGWATGCGTGVRHPVMWLNYRAFKDTHALAHEFAHCMQFTSQGMRDSQFVGWFWESHAEWMTHQMYPQQVGCSDQLVNAPHLYYGSTRDRYGNWQFWEHIKDTFGYSAINRIWTDSRKSDDPKRSEESPLGVLCRNMNWSVEQLNDQFGYWAMRNVTWDYTNGAVYRAQYAGHDDPSPYTRHRASLLNRCDPRRNLFAIPDYHAPQRFGYNHVRLQVDSRNASRRLLVRFQGIAQKVSGVESFSQRFENEPKEVPSPDSGWRWGLVAVRANGTPRYSQLQRGVSGQLSWQADPTDRELWLVVVATPTKYHMISWDQMYYTIYRYPWMVEIQGGYPERSNPTPVRDKRDGAPHRNGGGWVDKTAHVDATAYVGPHAQVLETAQVLNHARVEDQAIVSGSAVVKDAARVRNHAFVTGKSAVGGKACVGDEAAIYDGTIDEEAAVGALTIVTGQKTHIHGQATVRAVMNTIDGFDLSGTVQLLGDIELRTSLSKGVFYGMITPEMAADTRWGANRTAPEPEVTKAP